MLFDICDADGRVIFVVEGELQQAEMLAARIAGRGENGRELGPHSVWEHRSGANPGHGYLRFNDSGAVVLDIDGPPPQLEYHARDFMMGITYPLDGHRLLIPPGMGIRIRAQAYLLAGDHRQPFIASLFSACILDVESKDTLGLFSGHDCHTAMVFKKNITDQPWTILPGFMIARGADLVTVRYDIVDRIDG